MIFVKSTPNNAGVSIYGDHRDFEELYEAMHTVVGGEDEFTSFSSARFRVLGVCYDIRHALMGDREIEPVDNGMAPDMMKRQGMIVPTQNIYLKINVLWPEILFVTMALNDFITLYTRKKAGRNCYYPILDKQNIWDGAIAQVRVLQAAIDECIKETVADASYSRVKNLLIHSYTWLEDYATQYLDMLNCRFIKMDKEKRLKNIPTMAKRLAEQGEEYRRVEEEIEAVARENNCPVENVKSIEEYPEDWEW